MISFPAPRPCFIFQVGYYKLPYVQEKTENFTRSGHGGRGQKCPSNFVWTVAAGAWLEVGISAHYSALWLSLAAAENGRTLTTFELLPEKIALAQETFRQAGVTHLVEQVAGDARHFLRQYAQIA